MLMSSWEKIFLDKESLSKVLLIAQFGF